METKYRVHRIISRKVQGQSEMVRDNLKKSDKIGESLESKKKERKLAQNRERLGDGQRIFTEQFVIQNFVDSWQNKFLVCRAISQNSTAAT